MRLLARCNSVKAITRGQVPERIPIRSEAERLFCNQAFSTEALKLFVYLLKSELRVDVDKPHLLLLFT
jgi:hypothetical protein